jgi:hypothetical protein
MIVCKRKKIKERNKVKKSEKSNERNLFWKYLFHNALLIQRLFNVNN